MSDIGLFLVNNCIDLKLNDDPSDLLRDEGLETAVLISLFSDKRIPFEEVPFGETSRRGWWGDLIPEVDGDLIGSKLWTLERVKVILSTRVRAEEAVKQALEWLIEDGIVETVEVEASFDSGNRNRINLEISIKRPENPEVEKFSIVWDAQALVR